MIEKVDVATAILPQRSVAVNTTTVEVEHPLCNELAI